MFVKLLSQHFLYHEREDRFQYIRRDFRYMSSVPFKRRGI
jgi:hypothetical protein